jgi:ADP-ribosylglycohydrolase
VSLDPPDDAWLWAVRTRVRGLMLGLALGEAVVGDVRPSALPLLSGVGTQLTCFTVEGLIRASVRQAHRGISSGPAVVWHAYRRWGALQGLVESVSRDGWLTQVDALGERRGSAPATVEALRAGRAGTPTAPTTSSAGGHALVRTLPVGVLGLFGPFADARERLHGLGAEVGALTHGHQDGYGPAADGAVVVAALLDEGVRSATSRRPSQSHVPDADPRAAINHAVDILTGANVPPHRRERLGASGSAHDGDRDRTGTGTAPAPDRTAQSCLDEAVRALCAFPRPDQAAQALERAGTAPDGQVTAAVAGALLGSLHGMDALPVSLVSRLELAWVADTLARDFVRELTEGPSGGEYVSASDPHWWSWYPGG